MNPWLIGGGLVIALVLIVVAILSREKRAAVAASGLGIALVAGATILQMFVDWYQSEAQGVPMPTILKVLIILAGAMTLLSLIIGLTLQKR